MTVVFIITLILVKLVRSNILKTVVAVITVVVVVVMIIVVAAIMVIVFCSLNHERPSLRLFSASSDLLQGTVLFP